jgi:hypothetical protein
MGGGCEGSRGRRIKCGRVTRAWAWRDNIWRQTPLPYQSDVRDRGGLRACFWEVLTSFLISSPAFTLGLD